MSKVLMEVTNVLTSLIIPSDSDLPFPGLASIETDIRGVGAEE